MPLPFTVRRTDPDAAAFCARSGASDRAALSAFVRGVKDLGLWENMVCWPLRSTQNAGTGTTAYSLGGLGTFDGTLTNGPVWGVNGITFDGSNDFVTAQPTTVTTSQCFGLVHDNTTDTGTATMSVSESIVSQTELRLRPNGDLAIHSAASWAQSAVTGSFSRSGFGLYAASWDSDAGQAFVQRNATANAAVARTYTGTTSNRVYIMSGPSTQYTAGVASFVFLINAKMNSTASVAFYTLYKSTLGTGLGLP
jgi:hypothetical protein